MNTARKITVEVPRDLLDKAQRASGKGITQTVRTGLQLLAASQAYDRLLQSQGNVRLSRHGKSSKMTDDHRRHEHLGCLSRR